MYNYFAIKWTLSVVVFLFGLLTYSSTFSDYHLYYLSSLFIRIFYLYLFLLIIHFGVCRACKWAMYVNNYNVRIILGHPYQWYPFSYHRVYSIFVTALIWLLIPKLSWDCSRSCVSGISGNAKWQRKRNIRIKEFIEDFRVKKKNVDRKVRKKMYIWMCEWMDRINLRMKDLNIFFWIWKYIYSYELLKMF